VRTAVRMWVEDGYTSDEVFGPARLDRCSPLRSFRNAGHASIAMTMDAYGHLLPLGNDGQELAEAECLRPQWLSRYRIRLTVHSTWSILDSQLLA